ncbi:lysophospholipid acyltransferase family protein [Sandaracinobacteroides saxicola]|uniref:1-acyl-sn-glycerol-3-phosphate acyltransferase n=1 Tax=Sandaracinobacteroides saxicola TaxID=2759707 RepID=A0A7G5ILZ5_9SPHN|nr:lysophospholipid acyltransferase family protein [Sandaracinobacteroides saxicola]QMW24387.1 1-acyl-sn-glycerol-3-phosphate acyltransferase [Sandaracinobacteroides saxicola]
MPLAAERPFQRMGHVKSVSGVLAATGVIVPAIVATRAVSLPKSQRLPLLFHRMFNASLGVHVRLQGTPANGSVLYVSNHLSWMDIPVLGSQLHGSFVAKSEVGAMGFVGFMADLQRTIYIERARRQASGEQSNAIADRLRAGENVFLFPEGTTNDGVHLLPFKSTLFSVVEGPGSEDFRIQPLSVAYTELNGLPMTRNRRIEISWIGDTDLGPHALDFMRMGRFRAEILCHEPIRRADFANRKELAKYCQAKVAEGYRTLTRGHA